MQVKILDYIECPILYCNGICSNDADKEQSVNLRAQTDLLRSVFHRNVCVFNNPTGLGEYFTNDETQTQTIDAIAAQFATCIRQQVQKAGGERIPLFAHSHGALITKLALEKLTPDVTGQVDVYAFGGVVMLSKTLAHSVKNYVNKGDMICRAGNDKFDPEHVLEKIIKVTDRMQLDSVALEEAVLAQFEEDWFREYQWGTEKISEFVNNFWTGNADNVVGADGKYAEYASFLKNYDVKVIPCALKPTLQLRTFTEVTPAMKQHIAGYATAVDNTCHRLFTYRPVLEEIAKAHL